MSHNKRRIQTVRLERPISVSSGLGSKSLRQRQQQLQQQQQQKSQNQNQTRKGVKPKPFRRRIHTMRISKRQTKTLHNKINNQQKPKNLKNEVRLMLKGLANNTDEERQKRKTMSMKKNNPIEMMNKGNHEALLGYISELYQTIEERENEIREVAMAGLRVSKENQTIKNELKRLSSIETHYQTQKNELDNLKSAITDLETQNQTFESTIQDYESDTQNLIKKNLYLRKKVEEAWTSNQKYLDELKKADEDLQKYKNHYGAGSNLAKENEELKLKLDHKKKKNQELKNTLEKEKNLKKEYENLKNKYKNLNEQYLHLEHEKNKIIEKYEKNVKELDKYLKQTFSYEESEKENRELKAINYWLEKMTIKNSNMLQGIYGIIEWFSSEKNKKIILGEKIFTNANDALIKIVKTLKNGKNQKMEILKEIEMYSSEIEENENEFVLLEDSNNKRRILYLTLLLFYQLHVSKLMENELKFKQNNSDLREEIDEYSNKLQRSNNKIKELEKLLKQTESNLNNQSKGKNELEKLKERLRNELKLYNMKEEKLRNEMDQMKQNLMKDHNKKLLEKEKEFKKKKGQWQKREMELMQEIVETRNRFEKKIKAKESEIEKEKKRLERKMNMMKRKFELEKNEINSKHLTELEDLQFKLDEMEIKYDDLQKQKNKMEKVLNSKIKEYETKFKKLNSGQSSMSRFQIDQMNILKKKLEDTELQLEIEQQKNKRAAKQKLQYQKQLKLYKIKLQKLMNGNRKLEEENDKLYLVIKQLKEEIKNLRQQLEEALNIEPQVITETVQEEFEEEIIESNREIDIVEQMMTDYINKELKYDLELNHLLPIGKTTPDLVDAMRDGLLLCKLVNHIMPGTIDERVINVFEEIDIEKHMDAILENHTLCVNSALALGCNVRGISSKDLLNEEEVPCLQLCWEIIKAGLLSKLNAEKHPEILELCEKSERQSGITALHPEDLILRWVNYHLKRGGYKKKLTNFSDDLKDSVILGLLLSQLDPKNCPIKKLLSIKDTEQRAKLICKFTHAMKITYFLSPIGITRGEDKLNLAFLAYLFDIKSGIQAQKKPKSHSKIPDVGTREERSFRMWINSLGVKPKVYHLYEDLKDGHILFQVIDKITPPNTVNWKIVKTNCRNMYEKINNCNRVVDLGKRLGIKLRTTGGRDIYDGNKTMVLGYVWQLMRYHVLSILKKLNVLKGLKIDDSAMVNWANLQVKNAGKNSKILSFKDQKLQNSIFLIDLIYSINPKAVNYNFVSNSSEYIDKMDNARLVISLTRKLGGTIFLLPEDIVEVKDKMILTLVGEFMRLSKKKN
ncbi:fimbrin-2 [Anaeramoeba flamelloides]|uniref:Fimbrin-2 n=1 Tax=Anaeramoeba flamelloides TaxID=1746091 RepID=A0AAV7YT85_9EUKA|nr:fimbrin-2 [Anaeramoeba flamelloides]